jgi:hypothetical protein
MYDAGQHYSACGFSLWCLAGPPATSPILFHSLRHLLALFIVHRRPPALRLVRIVASVVGAVLQLLQLRYGSLEHFKFLLQRANYRVNVH